MAHERRADQRIPRLAQRERLEVRVQRLDLDADDADAAADEGQPQIPEQILDAAP